MKLSIVIPAYNEAGRLPHTLARIYDRMKNFHEDFEVFVANDGSTDETSVTVKMLAETHSQLRLLDYPVNRGRGEVCKNAVVEAEGDYILITDADGSTDEKFIMPFVEYLDAHSDVDIIVGSRDIEGAIIHTPQPPLRIFLNKVFLLMARVLFGWPMHDRVNGFKMGRRRALLDIYRFQTENSFFAEAELIYIADHRSWRVIELPIEWTDDRDSRVKPFKEAWDAFFGMFKVVLNSKRGLYK